MEREKFEEIRQLFCVNHDSVTKGKMMSSPALHYKGKVFAFFSRKQKMVFKLGKNHGAEALSYPLQEFSPFKTKKPLTGWYEIPFISIGVWKEVTLLALETIKKETA